MAKSKFVNEIGNSIEIKVKKRNGTGTNYANKKKCTYRGVVVEIIGPTSMSSNEITLMEARKLLATLQTFFRENL